MAENLTFKIKINLNARNFPLIVIHDPLDSFKAALICDYIKKPESFNQMALTSNQILTFGVPFYFLELDGLN